MSGLINGGLKLKERDGTFFFFNPDGTLDYMEDTNGNRITASYQNGLRSRLTASNGSFLEFGYVSPSKF